MVDKDIPREERMRRVNREQGNEPLTFKNNGREFEVIVSKGHFLNTVIEFEVDGVRDFIVMSSDCDERYRVIQMLARDDKHAQHALVQYHRLHAEHDGLTVLGWDDKHHALVVRLIFSNTAPPDDYLPEKK